jgi:hypothetical protein
VSVGYEGQDESFVTHPAWVLTWVGSKPRRHGGSKKANTEVRRQRLRLLDTAECIYVTVVNAMTGQLEDSRQLCH